MLHPVSEAERADVALVECESLLRRAQHLARQAAEASRRAHREVAEAEAALSEAARRVTRVPATRARAGRGWS